MSKYVYSSNGQNLLSQALKDFYAGLCLFPLCCYLGWEDVKQRYIRTLLGPLWIIISTGIWVAVMAFVMASLFGQPVAHSLPFIAAGVSIWNFIGGIMTESCSLFPVNASLLQAINLPITVHVLRFLIRNVILFAHNFIILLLVFFICHIGLHLNTLWVIPGFIILLLNSFWVTFFLSLTNLRFRDIQQIIATSMMILPFVTPIFWEKSFLQKHHWIANINPFYHFVEIVRAPLLGQTVPLLSWGVTLGFTVFGLLGVLWMFSKYKHRIIFWL